LARSDAKENVIVATILARDLPIVKNVKKDIIISKDYAMNAKKVLLDVKNALMLMRKLTKAKDLNVKNV
jgi:hypothetical protein